MKGLAVPDTRSSLTGFSGNSAGANAGHLFEGNMAGWTEADIEKAAELWGQGLSCSAIAQRMGRSRNSVASIALRRRSLFAERPKGHNKRAEHAQKLKRERVERQRQAAPKQVKEPKPPVVVVALPEPVQEQPFVPRNVTLMERAHGECCWPTNDGGPFLFCALPVEHGPYCNHHSEILVGTGTAGERSAARELARAA